MQLLTEQELNASGGMSTQQGGVQSGYNPNLSSSNSPMPTLQWQSSSTPVPAATTAPSPNVASELDRIKNEALAIQSQLNNPEPTIGQTLQAPGFETGPTFEELYPDINEDAIRRNQMRLFQSEINATNKVYDEMLGRERLIGTGRLGTQRAQAARGGLIGSDFGNAQEERVTQFNQGAQNAVQAERSAKIGSIMGTMRKAVADEITEKRLARQQGAENYIDYLTSARERKTRNLDAAATAFLTQNIDPSTLSPDELEAISQEAGLSTSELINQYRIKKGEMESQAATAGLETRKTEAEINKIEADIAKGKLITIGEGTMLYDTETGETFKNPKTNAPGTDREGVPSSVLSTVRDRLESVRGEDTYTDTGDYLNEYASYVEAGGSPEQFLKSFDPNKYINPNDPSRGWLDSQMKKTTGVDPIDAIIAEALGQSLGLQSK